MTHWFLARAIVALVLSMLLLMLRDVDRALEEADLEIRLDRLWDDIDAEIRAELQAGAGAGSAVRDGGTLALTSPVRLALPACVVCGDLGCSHCPKVTA